MTDILTRQKRDLLEQILDLLIPANTDKGIPSAGRIGVARFIETQVEDNAQSWTTLNDLLSSDALNGARVTAEMVRQLEAEHGEKFTWLLSLTYKAYYSRPDVRSLIGLGDWPVHPRGYDVPVEPRELIEKLTAPVRQRGAMYRDPGKDV